MKEFKYRTKFELLFGQRLLTVLLILLQFALLLCLIAFGSQLAWLKIALSVFSFLTALHQLTRKNKHAFKFPWIFFVLLFPIFGGVMYWILHFQTLSTKLNRSLCKSHGQWHDEFRLLCEAQKSEPNSKQRDKNFFSFMHNTAHLPTLQNTSARYYPDGALMLADMLEDLKNAKCSIFMEYYIIEEGLMWNSVLEVLRERVAAGVDVRVMYDDLGSLTSLPYNYKKTLQSWGIQCQVFNRFSPRVTCFHNNRDHRKITVIDNKIAYTGGINLADEYINFKHLFGHWRDAAVRVEGSAAKSFTLMFLQMWNLLSKSPKPVTEPMPEQTETLFEGWVLPYTDHPTESIHTGEHIFLHSIQRAQSKLYITTPYLMIGDELIAALKNAAQSGVDVRIITPGIPDKKLIYLTTRSYYRELIEAGVKIYEYTPGFIHSKNLICDDDFCVVGTSNMDYRSLYVNFECGACFYDAPIVEDVKRDMEEVLSLSREVTVADCKVNFLQGILQDICRLFANIM